MVGGGLVEAAEPIGYDPDLPNMPTGYASERFDSKKDLKRAVESGRRLIVTSKLPDPLGPSPEPGPFTGTMQVIEPIELKPGFHLYSGMTGGWVAKVDVENGIIVRVR